MLKKVFLGLGLVALLSGCQRKIDESMYTLNSRGVVLETSKSKRINGDFGKNLAEAVNLEIKEMTQRENVLNSIGVVKNYQGWSSEQKKIIIHGTQFYDVDTFDMDPGEYDSDLFFQQINCDRRKLNVTNGAGIYLLGSTDINKITIDDLIKFEYSGSGIDSSDGVDGLKVGRVFGIKTDDSNYALLRVDRHIPNINVDGFYRVYDLVCTLKVYKLSNPKT